MVQLVLEHGADLNPHSFWVNKALWWAADDGNLAVAKLLLDHGASIDFEGTPGRSTPLMTAIRNIQPIPDLQVQAIGRPLEPTAQVQDYEDVARLLVSSGADTNLRARSGETALHYAVDVGSSRLVELLISHSADPTIADYYGWTPLHHAASNGHEDTAKILLAHNVDVDAPTLLGQTALHLAADGGYANMVLLLVDHGSDLRAIDYQGGTALRGAVFKGHDKTIKAFLKLGANPNSLNINGNSALSTASCSSKPEVCELLLPATTDINSQDGDGDTALSNAVHYLQPVYIIELLLEAGAQIVPQQAGPHCPFLHHAERINGYGSDALLEAWNKKHLDLLQTILSFAARRDPSGDYATALELWEQKEMENFEAWMELRRANALENRPEIVAFRKEIKRRKTKIYRQNKRRIATELGMDPDTDE